MRDTGWSDCRCCAWPARVAWAAGVVWLMLFGCVRAVQAQPSAGASGLPVAATRPMHQFDVVSIRENKDGGRREYGPTADGYRMVNGTLAIAILSAYVPEPGGPPLFSPNLAGLPDWAKTAHFDIDAKVPPEDLAAWQDPLQQAALLREMMQAMLADRFKLVVHREKKEVPVFSMVVAKDGPKMKPSTGEPHPHGRKIPGYGGEITEGKTPDTVNFYDATMAALAPLLAEFAGRPVQDQTGLTGKYDFTARKPAELNLVTEPGARDMGPSVDLVLKDLGLKLVPTRAPVERLVIDRAQPPDAN